MEFEKKQVPKELIKVERLKKSLEKVAFISLFFDIAIAVVTLVTLNTGKLQITDALITLLNYALTIIVIVSVVIFAAILTIKHYQDVEEIILLRKWRDKLK